MFCHLLHGLQLSWIMPSQKLPTRRVPVTVVECRGLAAAGELVAGCGIPTVALVDGGTRKITSREDFSVRDIARYRRSAKHRRDQPPAAWSNFVVAVDTPYGARVFIHRTSASVGAPFGSRLTLAETSGGRKCVTDVVPHSSPVARRLELRRQGHTTPISRAAASRSAFSYPATQGRLGKIIPLE